MSFTKKKLVCLFILVFFLKLGLAFCFSRLLFHQYPSAQLGFIAVDSGDTFSYLGSIDNLLATGEYFFEVGDHQKVYAGRMPYYGTPYFLLRLFLAKSAAYDIYVILQIAFDALATVVFAWLCFEVCRRKAAFWIGLLIYLCTINYISRDIQLWTESFSLSFLVFFIYFSHLFWLRQKWSNAVWATLFLALITVLKPYWVLIYPVFFLSVWFILRRSSSKDHLGFSDAVSKFYKTALLGLPLLLLLTPWIIRNFVFLGKFIPAQQDIYAGYDYTKAQLAFIDFASSWGAGSVFWDTQDAGCYFLIDLVKSGKPCEYKLPDYAIADSYSREDVERVRQDFFKLQADYSPELDESVTAEFERLTKIYRQERLFMYHIGARFLFFEKLFNTGYYRFPILKNSNWYWIYQSLFDLGQTGIHIIVLAFGAFSLLNLAFKRKISFTFVLIPLIITILFIELRTTEGRYVDPVYTFLLFGLTAAITSIGVWLKTFWSKRIFSRFSSKY